MKSCKLGVKSCKLGNVANVKVLPIANTNVANWKLENGTGNIGNIQQGNTAAKVIGKERDKEKGKSPHTPLKEKETEKETTGSVSGSRVRVRVGADTFFDPALDPVSVAVAVFGGNRDDRRLWRWYLYRIGEDAFRQLAFTQWRENRSDGIPNNPPACFQCKLTAALKAQSAAAPKGGAR